MRVKSRRHDVTCEKLQSCEFTKHMSNIVPYTISMVRITYCQFNKSNCARYKMAKILDDVEIPLHLWPSNTMKVLELMEREFRAKNKEMCTVPDHI